MNKEHLEEQALLYALGTLPRSEVEAFEATLRQDRELQAVVHEGQRLNELQAEACSPCSPPFQAYSKLMARIEAESAPARPRAAADAASGRFRPASVLSWGGWGLAACAALVLGLQFLLSERGSLSGPKADIVVNNLSNPRLVAVQPPSEQMAREDRMLELAGLAEAYWFAREGIPSDQLLAENPTAELEQLSGGFTIFDRRYQIGFIGVENMPKEPEGKSYHVWARLDNGSRAARAGALPIDDASRGLFFFDLSSLATEVESLDQVTFFVTEESSDEPERPDRSMIVLSGL